MARIFITGSTDGLGRAAARSLLDAGHHRPWDTAQAYAESKLRLVALALALARRWPDVLSNAVDPGWVPTKMGGPSAPDDLELGHRTQEWLAVSDDPEAETTGGYWHHRQRRQPHAAVHDERFQDRLLAALAEETGTPLPSSR